MAPPPKNCNTIQKLYKDISVKLQIGKLTWNISQSVGVKQGDFMAHALSLFLIVVFTKTLEDEWAIQGLNKVQFQRQS